jgi:hypothetical protein
VAEAPEAVAVVEPVVEVALTPEPVAKSTLPAEPVAVAPPAAEPPPTPRKRSWLDRLFGRNRS